jgi:anthranilate synthase component I
MNPKNKKMQQYPYKSNVREILADTVTPVSIYMRIRTLYSKSILLESSDYRGKENACSFICFQPVSSFVVEEGKIILQVPGGKIHTSPITAENPLEERLDAYFRSFKSEDPGKALPANGLFGYISYDAVSWFENLKRMHPIREAYKIPEIKYCFYKYVIAIGHHSNTLHIIENLFENEESQMDYIHHLMVDLTFSSGPFKRSGREYSNITDDAYRSMVTKGKEHCSRGDVFQVVLSRQFRQAFEGDDFNVYRALRSINPSPYLFYFDYGTYKIFGSSPEAELRVQNNKAYIHPIAGTFRRTGQDAHDRKLAEQLSQDPKENAEHIMLVDLARNDLSRSAENVVVEAFREIQFFSHVIHLVSRVSGDIGENTNLIRLLGETFPAGTLSGAPKHRAMQLIEQYENQNRGFYGGCIGYLGFDRTLNHAIMIRSFLSKGNQLFYQAGAGIVAGSVEEKELQEVNNKLAALKKAVSLAENIH